MSESTRSAVLGAARTMGYRPNGLARSLAFGNTHRIAVYSGLSDLDSKNIFYAEILSSLVVGCREARANLLVHTSGCGPDELIDLVSSRSADGIVVHLRPQDPLSSILSELRVPAISICDEVNELPNVVVDDAYGGALQATYLADLGHRRVLYRDCFAELASVVRRRDAFLETCASRGVEVEVTAMPNDRDNSITAKEFVALTDGVGRATAMVCWDDGAAHGTCTNLTNLGFSIPDDVSVVGFNGIQSAFPNRFDLTTVRAPWQGVGRTAILRLQRLIAGESVPFATILPVDFYPGATCAPPSSLIPPRRGTTPMMES